METTRTGGKRDIRHVCVVSSVCVCVCYLHVAVACGDSLHVSAVYWNIAGTCLCPEVFNGYLRANAGNLFLSLGLFLFLALEKKKKKLIYLCFLEKSYYFGSADSGG